MGDNVGLRVETDAPPLAFLAEVTYAAGGK